MSSFREYHVGQESFLPVFLDQMIPEDHAVRVIHEVVERLNIEEIETKIRKRQTKDPRRGRDAYHPRLLLKIIFYGYATGTFSSRKLAYRVLYDIPMIWLAARQTPDFRTISDFRKEHLESISKLFVQVLQLCGAMGMVKLGHVALDGSKIKANASKHKAMSAGHLQKEVKELRAEVEAMLQKAQAVDSSEDAVHGDGQGDELPRDLQDKQERLARLEQALAELQRRADAQARERRGSGKAAPSAEPSGQDRADEPPALLPAIAEPPAEASPPQAHPAEPVEQGAQPPAATTGGAGEATRADDHAPIPAKMQINFTDPDSRMMISRNEGPVQAYNPQIAVDSAEGVIVGRCVSNDPVDTGHMAPTLDDVTANCGRNPEKLSADPGYFSGENIAALHKRQVDGYIAPTREGKAEAGNPYDKKNFRYDPERDAYECPQGQWLDLNRTGQTRKGRTFWVYEGSDACLTCPVRALCTNAKTGRRTVQRDDQEPLREAMRTKVRSEAGYEVYKQRKGIVEPVWGQIKEGQGFRRFSLRGLEQVAAEFDIVITCHNLLKIARKLCRVPEKWAVLRDWRAQRVVVEGAGA